jgi:hypothetical protein
MENQHITAEELHARKAELKKHFDSEIPFLETQLKYETLMADIEEQRARRTYSMVKMAQMMAPPSEEPNVEAPNTEE